MSIPTNENGLSLAAVDFGGRTRRNWARSESEWSPQGPQQVQRPGQRQRRASWGGGGGLWLMVCARTLIAKTTGKHNCYYYFYYVLIHSVVCSGFSFFFCIFFHLVFWDLCVL